MRTRIDDEREAPDVAAWRCGRLVAAGFTFRDAARLATDPRYDVHELVDLVARGCPPELAARILAPLDQAEAA